MSAASGEPNRRPGFFDSFRAAMTPPPLSDDDGKPPVRPWTVLLSVALAVVAGLALIFVGIASAATVDTGAQSAVQFVDDELAKCITDGIGRGAGVVVPEDGDQQAQARATFCRDQQPLTAEEISEYKRNNTILGIVVGLVGIATVAGGVLMLRERLIGRKIIITVTVLLVASSLLLGLRSLPLLLATLFLVGSVMLTLIGKGNRYFQILRRRARS
jgi:hypothetical protein